MDRQSICFQSRGTVGLKDKRSAPPPHPHPPREGLLTALLLWVAVKHSHMLSCCWKVEATKIERGKMLEKKDRHTDVKGFYVSVWSRRATIQMLLSWKCFTVSMAFRCSTKSLRRLFCDYRNLYLSHLNNFISLLLYTVLEI